MSYERTNWVNGETPINADNLNNMEEGILNAHENFDGINTKLYKQSFRSVSILDTLRTLESGFYYFFSNCTDKPSGSTNGFSVILDKEASYNIIVIAVESTTCHMYTNFYGSSWSGWKQQLNSGGGAMTGALYTQNVRSTSDAAHMLGDNTHAWKGIYTNALSMYKGGVSYGSMQVLTDGTESVTGYARQVLGNNIPRGTTGNSIGALTVYGSNTACTIVTTSNVGTETNSVMFPSGNGTLALQSEVQALETRIAQLEAALGVATTNIENTEEIE